MINLRTVFGGGARAMMVLLVVGVSTSGAGQGTGTISGAIEDESGGVLPGVTVTATDTDSGAARTAVSDGQGRYAITNLSAGSYDVRGVLPGFSSDAATVALAAGGSAMVDMSLTIAPLTETVTVTRVDQDLSAVPSSVAVVQRDQIEYAQRRASLDEALRGIPGLFVQNRRNYGLSGGIGLSIRAPQPRFGLRGLAIIQDGIPITTADGTTEPGNVDLGSVGRIDVIRGPSSVLYGNSAGGVINLNTTFDTSRPPDDHAGHPVRELRLQPAAGQAGWRQRRHAVHGECQPVRDRRLPPEQCRQDHPGERRRAPGGVGQHRDPWRVQPV